MRTEGIGNLKISNDANGNRNRNLSGGAVPQLRHRLPLTEICSNIIVPFALYKCENWSLVKSRA